MRKIKYILITIITLITSVTCVKANYEPKTIENKEDLVYFIRYYNGSQSIVKQKTVILQDDLILNGVNINFNLKKSFTFDINGHKIKFIGNKSGIIVNGDNKLLTIIDSSKGKGFIKSFGDAIIVNSGNVIFDSVKLISNSKECNGLFVVGGKVKILDGEISSKENAILMKYGYLQVDSGVFEGSSHGLIVTGGKTVINGGLFKGSTSGLKLNNYKSFHLKSGEFITTETDNSTFKYHYNNIINNLNCDY